MGRLCVRLLGFPKHIRLLCRLCRAPRLKAKPASTVAAARLARHGCEAPRPPRSVRTSCHCQDASSSSSSESHPALSTNKFQLLLLHHNHVTVRLLLQTSSKSQQASKPYRLGTFQTICRIYPTLIQVEAVKARTRRHFDEVSHMCIPQISKRHTYASLLVF